MATLPFPAKPKARGNLKPGSVYAVDGGDSYIYYVQIDSEKNFGFLRFRNEEVDVKTAMTADLMCHC